MQEEIIDKISETLRIARDQINPATRLTDIVQDSLDAFELLAVMDSDYRVRIDPAQINELASVGDLCAYVEANQGTVAPEESLKTI